MALLQVRSFSLLTELLERTFLQVIIPLMVWESTEFSRPVLAVVIVCSLAFFPMFIFPSGPSMWLSGMMFGYGYGFLIIMGGTTIGQSLPYFIGHWLLHDRIQVRSISPSQSQLHFLYNTSRIQKLLNTFFTYISFSILILFSEFN